MSPPTSRPATGHYQKRTSHFQDYEKRSLSDSEKGLTNDLLVAVAEALPDFDDPNWDQEAGIEGVMEDDSPYPEVRSAVSNTDDPDIPVGTLRAWVLGIIWAILLPGLNQLFFFRYPSVDLTSIVAQLVSFPMGKLWAAVVPNVKIFGISLNPGPFTVKEHVLVTIMASVGWQSAYATDIVAVQRIFYNQRFSFAYQWMLVMSTQMIGFSIGGIARRFLVQPPSMIWPATLVYCALFNTLHSAQYSGMGSRGGITRERFFLYVFIGSTVWYFVPGYLFTALSYFNWVCWIAPDNVIVNQLFGEQTGLGMSLLTFDWAQIAYIGSPLATPWWAEANILGGFVFFYWFLAPLFYYTNTWYAKYMPMSTTGSFDNTGAPYNITAILNPDATFNQEKYEAYSPIFLSMTFALSYGISFASQLWGQARKSMHEQPDIHARLMSRYPQVPQWWYAIIFCLMFMFGILVIELWDTKFPIGWFVVALLISFAYCIPVGMILAITNQQVGLNVITELIIGYALPGRPIAMMMFKTWGYITMSQALQFTADFKLGHYMKIPPRQMFFAQIIATVIAGTTQLGVQTWVFSNIPGVCTPDQPNLFTCPGTEVFGVASFVWGVIGPERQFSKGQIYENLVWFFLVGAIAPVITWLIHKKWPNSFIRYVNFPVVFTGLGLIPPATALNYVPWAIVGFLFQYIIRRRHFSWWTKYNYTLSAALDSGVAIGVVLVYFCLQFPKNGTIGAGSILSWWGNTFYAEGTADGRGDPLIKLGDGEIFGPTEWH
ncbi:OPT oligopeptide transporter [Flagelloscypha sp. PMI_526]|nr:OPT oligopeptide transporter [Flagelloscypha sp. PMI_526]